MELFFVCFFQSLDQFPISSLGFGLLFFICSITLGPYPRSSWDSDFSRLTHFSPTVHMGYPGCATFPVSEWALVTDWTVLSWPMALHKEPRSISLPLTGTYCLNFRHLGHISNSIFFLGESYWFPEL